MILRIAIDACPALASIAMGVGHEVFELPGKFDYRETPWIPSTVWIQLDHMIYSDKHAGRYRYKNGDPRGPATQADAHVRDLLRWWGFAWRAKGCLLFVVGGPNANKTARPVIGSMFHRECVVDEDMVHIWSDHGWTPPHYNTRWPDLYQAALNHCVEYIGKR